MTARLWPDLHSCQPDSGSLLLCHEHWFSQESLHQYMQLSLAPTSSRLLLLLLGALRCTADVRIPPLTASPHPTHRSSTSQAFRSEHSSFLLAESMAACFWSDGSMRSTSLSPWGVCFAVCFSATAAAALQVPGEEAERAVMAAQSGWTDTPCVGVKRHQASPWGANQW